jgi:hypothetical protein
MPRKAKRRVLDLDRLPHAEKTRFATEIIEFFTDDLPAYIARKSDHFDLAWAEADMFRTLAALPDSTLKKAGLDRTDLPALVLSAFHLIRVSDKKRRKSSRRATSARKRRPAKRRARAA